MRTKVITHRDSVVSKRGLRRDSGVTLLETMIASAVLLVGVLAMLSLFGVAVSQNWNQGDRATRTTEYAQDLSLIHISEPTRPY